MKTPIPDGWLPVGTILAGEYGSTALGVNSDESDTDVMAVAVEPRRFVTGVQRYAGERHSSAGSTNGMNNRSGKDDIDVHVHGLRKFAIGAGMGNPTFYVALFLPEYEVLDNLGSVLLENRHLFFSKHVPSRFLGYLQSQRRGLLNEPGGPAVRKHLVEQYGFDVKFAYHMVRLGWQGLEASRTAGHITMPFSGEQLRYLLDIRSGKVTVEEILDLCDGIEAQLDREIQSGEHRETADWEKISEVTDFIYEAAWSKFSYPSGAYLPDSGEVLFHAS
jgi:predicted nucleotidyltransferase